jgi:ABC-type uncharacterized transport system involved in gliding motility auxiliary subunit
MKQMTSKTIPVPFIALAGLILSVDGIVSWLANAPTAAWAVPWVLGTAIIVAALMMRLGQTWQISSVVGGLIVLAIGVPVILQGSAISALKLNNIPTILVFLVIFIGEIGVGIGAILTGRASAEGANFWVLIVAGLSVVILINYIGAKHLTIKTDLTSAGLESLSEQTFVKLKNLKTSVKVIAFFRDSDTGRTRYAALLKKYRDENPRFDFEFFDPDKYPDIVERENVNARGIPVVMKTKDRRELVTGFTEKDLTNALIKVTRASIPTIYFSTWHGERDIGRDMAFLKQRLDNLNFVVKTHKLSDADIPTDCSIFVLAGPKTALLELEAERLEKYLASGNKLLAMLDPSGTPLGIEDLLVKYGISVQPNIIVERQRGLVPHAGGFYMGERQSPYVRFADYSEHEIVKPLAGNRVPTGFFQARQIKMVPAGRGVKITGSALLRAGTKLSFGEAMVDSVIANPRTTFSSSGDPVGPFIIGVAIIADPTNPLTPEEIKSRIVVFGDSDFATDRMVQSPRGNMSLILNSLNWLSEDESLIAIQPKSPGEKSISLTRDEGTFLFLFSVWRFPAIVFIVGLIIWWFRRSRGPTVSE